jgi:hypothetical protein
LVLLVLPENLLSLLLFRSVSQYASLMRDFVLQLSQLPRVFLLLEVTLDLEFVVPLALQFLTAILGITYLARQILPETWPG